MKISHVISSTSKESGGTSTYLKSICDELSKTEEIKVISIDYPDRIEFSDKVNVSLFTKNKSKRSHSSQMKSYLKTVKTDLFHGHGLWEMPVHMMCKYAKSRDIPYIFSTHGMFEPWSLQQGKLKKKVARMLFQDKDILSATCIHATAEEEANNIRKLGFKNPIAVVPNGIDTTYFSPVQEDREKRILFLSRIHPKKGIENLIEAWCSIKKSTRKNWSIEIVGTGDEKYIQHLKSIVDKKEVSEQIRFAGPLYGNDKLDAYRKASLFVLPTYSENFGIVIAEALGCATPVITTKSAPWEELNTTNAGWWIEIGVEPLKKALESAIMLPEGELMRKGVNGRQLVLNNYSTQTINEQLLSLYRWAVTKRNKPDFIYD